jgi:hypothetical protein
MMQEYNLRNITKEILHKTTGKIFTELSVDLTYTVYNWRPRCISVCE